MGTVLVIDDHAYMRALLREHLEGLGFTVITASDGAEGLQVLERENLDLLISDILMPGEIEGIEVIATACELQPDIPIIAISAGGKAAAEGYLDAAVALGASTALGKPFNLDDLIEVLREVMPDQPDQTVHPAP